MNFPGMARPSRLTFLVLLVAIVTASGALAAPAKKKGKPRRPVTPPPLVWHVESMDGQVISTNRGDEAVNPASVVKAATTLWALERLGPDHRFETTVYARGTVDAKTRTLVGDLVVRGGADPDFQSENVFLVAEVLNARGIRKVSGRLVVDRRFWIGWEGGSEGPALSAERRALMMGERLRRALDPARWTRAQHAAWRAFATAEGRQISKPPSVVVRGGVRFESDTSGYAGTTVAIHRSKPLVETLRRFNCFSNNDIERVGGEIGAADELGAELSERLSEAGNGVQLSTTSGLGENRLTPRQMVGLMRELRSTAGSHGLDVEEILPVAGCDPGTVTRFFPRLSTGSNATALVGKTGTLTATDGGVSVLAGFINTGEGEFVFAVAAPRAAGKLRLARRVEEQWLLDLLARHGGARPRTCAGPLAGPADGAAIVEGPQARAGGAGAASQR
jgi:D-alanyl-D-alanine carboxypeptidase/D-alanyl-D-alanine-endopeptidase (penicillin-binding protein 4)